MDYGDRLLTPPFLSASSLQPTRARSRGTQGSHPTTSGTSQTLREAPDKEFCTQKKARRGACAARRVANREQTCEAPETRPRNALTARGPLPPSPAHARGVILRAGRTSLWAMSTCCSRRLSWRSGGTSSSGLCSLRTPSSWTSSARAASPCEAAPRPPRCWGHAAARAQRRSGADSRRG